jgi:hypothetical protein
MNGTETEQLGTLFDRVAPVKGNSFNILEDNKSEQLLA